MKKFFEDQDSSTSLQTHLTAEVSGETLPLRDVMLCVPSHLAPVPCCSVTRETLRDGLAISTDIAIAQHKALRATFADLGVACHLVGADPDLPDMCFTRDIAVTTPWGVTILNPAMPHRVTEAGLVAEAIERLTGKPAERFSLGPIEGGDICVARPGLLIVGISGERTSEAAAQAFAARFRREGWDVLLHRFDPHFLHLDTLFCMIDDHNALVCTEVLDDPFLAAFEARGIRVHGVSYKEARKLGCNIVSIDGTRLLTNAATPRVGAMLERAGYAVHAVAIDQFAACGGGLHCLTMPLRRAA